MLVSYRWLQEFVNFDLTPDELAELLTQSGLEVEAIEFLGQGLEQIVIGQIKEILKHPNADKLSLTKVDIGDQVLEIVCGAKNIFTGAKVPIARMGVALPNGMQIGQAKLRGVASFGMICSEDELGLSADRQPGVMIIERECQSGDKFIQVMDLDDYILELSITPNYAHCLSVIGVAREIAARVDQPLLKPELVVLESEERVEKMAEIEVLDPDLCLRYSARIIRGVRVSSSPEWLQNRLKVCGIRPINNVVDATNLVLLEMGQPLHAFDYDQLTGGKIVVRRAQREEKIVTLDGQEQILDEEVLCICDAEKPVCIAGVMGGANSEVTDQTVNVLLESAYFNPVSTRKAARKFAIHSEASYRFERGVDIDAVIAASARASQLIKELAGGEILEGIIDVYPEVVLPPKINLRTTRVGSLLGITLSRDEIAALLKRLFFDVEVNGNDLDVSVPSFRGDITRETDLIEEIARLYGYNNIPSQLPVAPYRIGRLTKSQLLEDQTKEFMNAMGLNETIHFSFINANFADKLNLNLKDEWRKTIKIFNPLSEEYGVMRRSLIPDCLRTIAFNSRRQNDQIGIFELARIYIPGDDILPTELRMLTAGVSGWQKDDRWKQNAAGYYHLKGILDVYAAKFGLGELIYEEGQHPVFHPGRTALIKAKGQKIGYLGEVHPDVLENYQLKNRVAIFELDFEKLVQLSDPKRNFTALPKHPALTRDLALVVDQKISTQEIEDLITAFGSEYLEKAEFFDLYQGQQLPQGKKSMAFALSYRAKDRTLTDDEVNIVFGELLKTLSNRLGAEIRS